ncbi:MAG: acetyl-CoA carboxylase biotin carboxyl carrier protein [Gemmatimonadaceae bacterium]
MIDLRYIKKLIEMLDSSNVDSIEIAADKGMRVRLAKTPRYAGPLHVSSQLAPPAPLAAAPGRLTPAEGTQAVGVAGEAGSGAAPRAPATEPALLEVKSPMVGTFYSSSEPGARPYVSPGTRVSKGQILCIIEAMKIMNEIESEYAGVVKEVLMENAQPVEYGQVLYRIDPNG